MLPARRRGDGPTRVFVLAAMLLPTASFGGDARPDVIRYHDDALTVRVDGMKNSEILDEVARQSGAEIRGQLRTTRDVSAEFDSIPLPQAFARLFGDQNFALVYDRRGGLKTVLLLDVSQGSDALVRARVATRKRAAAFPGSLTALLNGHPPVPVSGVVAEALGSNKATFSQLLDLSLHDDSATIRAEAVRTGMAAIEGEPPLFTALSTELDKADSAQLGLLLRAAARDQAEEIAANVMRDARTAEVRAKASSVLQQLRAGN